MLLLTFIPEWFFQLLLIVSVLLFLITKFLKVIPYYTFINYCNILIFSLSLFMIGANWNNNSWLLKVKEMEVKLAEAEALSSKENTKIVEKVITRREIVRQQGNEIIKYVDREITKYDSSCKLPEPVIEAHNKAAQP
jgi:CBS domain containing-hemolysin-like protein